MSVLVKPQQKINIFHGSFNDWRQSIGLGVGYNLQAAVFTSCDDDLPIVAGLETAYFVLIFDDLDFSLQFQEG
jgi:hypothetical protein